MTAGFQEQGFIFEESGRLAGTDFTPPERDTGEDQFAHAAGKICAACHHAIGPDQPARLRGEHDWVHDLCPVSSD